MRTSLHLLIASAISLGSIACTSDLWSRYVRDTDDSCVRIGCPSGGTCNVSTGLCEGGSSADMGTTDMADPAQDYFFGPPLPIGPTTQYQSENFYQMSTAQPESSSSLPDIWLSGPTQTMTQLVQTGGVLSFGSSLLKLDDQPCYLTSMQGSAKGQRDLMVGQLAQKFSRVAGVQSTTYSTALDGFKLLSVGDLNSDGFPDAIVTASKLKLATLFYKTYPSSTGDGRAEILLSDSQYQLQNKLNMPVDGPLISASIQQTSSRTASGFNVGVIGEFDETTARLVQVDVLAGTPTYTVVEKVTIPASDFAIPVDFNRDGFNDLVLIQLWDGNAPFGGVTGAVHVAHNSGAQGKPVFLAEHIVPVPFSPSLVLTAKVDDFDQDGFPDLAIVTANLNGGEVLLYRNEPPPATTKETLRKLRYIGKMSNNHAGRAVEFVDLNRDGCKDVLMLFSGGMGGSANGSTLLWAAGKKAGRGLPDCF